MFENAQKTASDYQAAMARYESEFSRRFLDAAVQAMAAKIDERVLAAAFANAVAVTEWMPPLDHIPTEVGREATRRLVRAAFGGKSPEAWVL